MKKILFLVDSIGPKKEYFSEFMAKNIPDSTIAMARFTDLVFDIDGKNIEVTIDSINKNIKEFDLVYMRRAGNKFSIPAANLAICLTYLNIKFFDTTFANIGPLGNKLTSYLRLSIAGVPTIPSFFCHISKIENYKKQIIEKFGFPLVAKELSIHRGEGVILIKDGKDFSKLPQVGPHGGTTEFLFQKFYKSDEEYRILVMKEKIGAYERKIRTNPNEFRSNVAIGAREEFLDINKIRSEIKDISIKSAKVLDIQIAGVDIMIDNNDNIWVLEVNRGPGITYDEKLSPELKNLAEFLTKES